MASDGPGRFFFVHVMRTGGTTLEQQVRRSFPREQVYPDPDIDFPNGDVMHHLDVSYLLGLPVERLETIRFFYGHFPYVVTEMAANDLTTFTVLRDPVDRTLSLLRVMRDQRPGWHDRTLDEIYDDVHMFPRLIHNHQTKMFSMMRHDQPRSYRDEIVIDAARLEVAKQHLARVDLIGFTEHFGEFLATLSDRFGWRLSDAARMNAAAESCDDESDLRARVAADNAIDLEFYEYARTLHTDRTSGVR
jgi:hypothetical protein